jgi:hypothetical protein
MIRLAAGKFPFSMDRDRLRWPLCEHQQFAVNLDRDQLGRRVGDEIRSNRHSDASGQSAVLMAQLNVGGLNSESYCNSMTFQICPGLETGDLKSSTTIKLSIPKTLPFPSRNSLGISN